jgi:hypothetical protein
MSTTSPLSLSLLFATFALVSLTGASAAEKRSARWMAHCAQNLKSEALKTKVVRRYCACMAGLTEEPEMLAMTQTDLERSYPPVHRDCHIRARRR